MAQPKENDSDPFNWISSASGFNKPKNVEKQSKSKRVDGKSTSTNQIVHESPKKNGILRLGLNFLFNDDKKVNTVQKSTAKPQEDDEKKPFIPKCICGEALIYIKAKSCYDGDGIVCDACNATKNGKILVYHCKNQSSPKHYGGYDLCQKCAKNMPSVDISSTAVNSSKNGVKYTLNKDGSLTFYPTPNVKRGTEVFDDISLLKSRFCPRNVEGLSTPNKKIVNKYSKICSFIQCAELAYAQHYPLLIKPEHIFLLILQGISVHVDKNAEALRSKYVDHDGKKTLMVKTGPGFIRGRMDNDWSGVIQNFVQQIDKNTKPDVVPLFTSDFSSSTLTEQIAAKITLMSTCKNYFDYRMMRCVCGFPEIRLEGAIEDWILLKEKVTQLLKTKVKRQFGAKWATSLLPILDRFIGAYKGDISMVFWNSMVYRGQWAYWKGSGAYGGGGRVKAYKKFISGWINTLFPYIGERNYENDWCFEPYSGDLNAGKQYRGDEYNKELTSSLGVEPKDFPEGTASAPVIWDYEGDEMKLQFVAGFTGFEQNKSSLQITPTVGWYIHSETEY